MLTSPSSQALCTPVEFQAMVETLREEGLEKTKQKGGLDYEGRRGVFAHVAQQVIRRHMATVMTSRQIGASDRDTGALLTDLVDAALGLWEYNQLTKMAAGNTSNLQVFGSKKTVVERTSGKREEFDSVFKSADEMREWVRRITRTFGDGEPFDPAQPAVDLYLPPGVRFHAMYEENSGCLVSLRFTNYAISSLDSLIQLKSLTGPEVAFLKAAVHARLNVVVSGSTNSGKTTLMRSMLAEAPPFETIVTIEDSQELELDRFVNENVNVVQMLERKANIDGHGAVSSAELFAHSLRARPDRTVVGESRGPVVLEFLQAINSGQDGAMTTLHASDPQAMVTRMVSCADGQSSRESVVSDIRTGLHLVVQILRDETTGSRYLGGIYQIDPTHESEPRVRFTDIFKGSGTAPSQFVTMPTGHVLRRLQAVDWQQPVVQTPFNAAAVAT